MYHRQHYVFDEHGYLDSHWSEREMAERRIKYLHAQGRAECKLILRFTQDGMGLVPEEM